MAFIFHNMLGMSSFPLTNSIIFQDGYCTTSQIGFQPSQVQDFPSIHSIMRGAQNGASIWASLVVLLQVQSDFASWQTNVRFNIQVFSGRVHVYGAVVNKRHDVGIGWFDNLIPSFLTIQPINIFNKHLDASIRLEFLVFCSTKSWAGTTSRKTPA